MFSSSSEAHNKGWFSRRHQDSAAHVAAQRAYQQRQDDKAARARAQNEATAERKAKALANNRKGQ